VPTAVGVSVTSSSGIGVSVADGERDDVSTVEADGLSVMAEGLSSCVPVSVSSVVEPVSSLEGVALAEGDALAEVSVAT
jgi:hypothetical protein